MRANHLEAKIFISSMLVKIERGSFITSLKGLAKDYHCSISKIRTFLSLLENDTMISTETTHKFTKISICNYDTYQNQSHKGTQKARRKHAESTQKDTNNNVINNDNNDNKAFSINDFENFWNVFPNSELGEKGFKKKAQEQFLKLNPGKVTLDILMTSIQNQANRKKAILARGEFTPKFQNVDRWLKNERWTDEIIDPGKNEYTYDEALKIDPTLKSFVKKKDSDLWIKI